MDDHLSPATDGQVIAQLSSCLALVRPVGMTERETEDWLNVAMTTIGDLPQDLLERGCAEARATCTHHGQIVPAIVKETRERWEARQRSARNRPDGPVIGYIGPAPAIEEPRRPLTQADVDRLPPPLIRIGLACGALAEVDGGMIVPAPEPS